MGDDTRTEAERIVARLRDRYNDLVERRNAIRFQWSQFMLFGLGGVLFGGLVGIVLQLAKEEAKRNWPTALFMAIGGMVLAALLYRSSVVDRRNALWREALAIERELTVEELSSKPREDFFTTLVGINFKYIEEYYRQTREQADKSFTLSAVVAIVGFLTVLAGIVLMYQGLTQPAYIATASGVLTEFIGAVFFYLYNRTILKMGEYHKKLVLTQNISLALKISENLSSPERDRALMQLLDRLSQDVNYLLVAEDAHVSAPSAPKQSAA